MSGTMPVADITLLSSMATTYHGALPNFARLRSARLFENDSTPLTPYAPLQIIVVSKSAEIMR